MGWQDDPILVPGEQGPAPYQPRVGHGLWDAVNAGIQSSATGLMANRRLPDVVLDSQHAKWWEKLVSGAAQMAMDTPEMAFGAAGGALAGAAAGSEVPVIGNVVGGIIGGGAGAMALPTAIRTALMQAYSKGQVKSVSDFLTRTNIVLGATGKDALIGGMTAGVGTGVKGVVGAALSNEAGQLTAGGLRTATAAGLGAEATTMAVAPAALDGRMPEPEDFTNAAIMMVGFKAAHLAAGRLRETYARTGIEPLQVMADAKADPTILEDLAKPGRQAKLEDEVRNDAEAVNPGSVPPAGPGEVSEPAGRAPRSGGPENGPGSREAAGGLGEPGSTTTLPEAGNLQQYQLRNVPILDVNGVRIVAGPRPPYFSFHGNEATDGQPFVGGTKTGAAGVGVYIGQTFDTASRYRGGAAKDGTPNGQVLALYHDTSLLRVLDLRPDRVYTPQEAAALGFDSHGENVSGREIQVALINELGPAGFTKHLQELGFNAVSYGLGPGGKAPAWCVFDPSVFKRVVDTRAWSPEEIARREAFDPTPMKVAGPAAEADKPEIPRAYQPVAQAQAAMDAVPGNVAPEVAKEFYGPTIKIPGEPTPTTVNYKYINTPDQVNGALERMSQVNEDAIQTQRRGSVPWEQTEVEAQRYVAALLGNPEGAQPRQPGTPAGAAELLARKQMLEGAANDMAVKARAVLDGNASPEQMAEFMASIDRAAMIQQEFLGARAEAGRALNILKDTQVAAEQAQQIQDLIQRFGRTPMELAQMVQDLDNPESALKFARDATKASTWDKVMEVYKAALISGPLTVVSKTISNTTFLALRPAVDLLAATGQRLVGAQDQISFAEPFARIVGNLQGIADGLKLAKSAFLEDGSEGLPEHRHANTGTFGYVAQGPFRVLGAVGALFRSMNERGEAYSLATRQAVQEGLNPLTHEFTDRVAELTNNPPEKWLDQIYDYGQRAGFKAPLGEKGQAVNNLVRTCHLEWAMPFINTPGNIFKEMTRLSPAAPLIGEWREDFAAGGAAQAKAVAEMALGTGLSAVVMGLAMAGHISGAGDPDPNKRNVAKAAGWQPYSVKIGDKWYSYQMIHPLGTLMGLAADTANAWEHMTPDESDEVPKILSTAFANAVTNQTFLKGIAGLTGALANPDKEGPRFIQQLAGSMEPGIVGQAAQLTDPYQRQVNGILDAVKSRIPGWRETLPPQRDPWGEPVASPDRLFGVSRITEQQQQSEDKVRTEAARLGLAAGPAPKTIHMPDAGIPKIGEIQLTPQQRDVYGDVAGHMAYQVMDQIVHTAGWDSMPDFAKQRVFKSVFEHAHQMGRLAAIPDEQRQQEIDRIAGELNKRVSQ